jgi:hypothetical protein
MAVHLIRRARMLTIRIMLSASLPARFVHAFTGRLLAAADEGRASFETGGVIRQALSTITLSEHAVSCLAAERRTADLLEGKPQAC